MRIARLHSLAITVSRRTRHAAAATAVLVSVGSVPVGMALSDGRQPSTRAATPISADRAASWPSGDDEHREPPGDESLFGLPDAPLPAVEQASTAVAGVVTDLGRSGIPAVALAAYGRAETTLAADDASCGLRWSLVAAIGRVESNHGRYGGAGLMANGDGTRPIRGIPLDGRPGVATIRDTDGGAFDGDTVFDRAVGPMQFIPSSWRRIAVDGNDDGLADPDNMFDAALGAGVYLCAGSTDVRDPDGRRAAVYRYNHSAEYVATVLALADAYERDGVAPLPGAVPVATPLPAVATPLPPATSGLPLGLPSPATPAPSTVRPGAPTTGTTSPSPSTTAPPSTSPSTTTPSTTAPAPPTTEPTTSTTEPPPTCEPDPTSTDPTMPTPGCETTTTVATTTTSSTSTTAADAPAGTVDGG